MPSQICLDGEKIKVEKKRKELKDKRGEFLVQMFFLPGKHANKCIGTLLRPCDGHREEEPERKTLKEQESFLLCKPLLERTIKQNGLAPPA